MATNYIAPTWRMPENGNQSKSSNYSLNFNGSNSVIDTGTSLTITRDLTLSGWVKFTSTNSGGSTVISKHITANGQPYYTYRLYVESNRAKFRIGISTATFITGTTDINDGNWHHILGTYDGSSINLYVDGVSDATAVSVSGDLNTNVRKTTIGGVINGDTNTIISNTVFNGEIGGVYIFNYALSESQAEELYGDSTSGPGDPMALPTPPIAYYKLGDNANLTSGGTLPNFPNLSVGGEVAYSNYSIKFATFDSFVFGNSGIMTGKNTYSISAWFKLDVNANGAIFSNWHGGLTVNYLLRYKSTNPIGIQLYIYSGGTTSRLDTGYIPTFGAWTHVVAVKDPITNGGQSRVYINGVELTPLNSTNLSSPTPNINREDQIGVVVSGLNFVNGNISNVAYWTTTALTEPQAEEIYNNGKTIDLNNLTFTAPTNWLPLDERSVYFNGATLQARDIINNVDASGVNLREENIVGDAPGSTSNGTGTNIDILDLKGDMNSSSKNAYSINMADYADGITNPANSGRSTNTP